MPCGAFRKSKNTMLRIFTGLEVPEDVAQSLSMLRGGVQGARWIDPENYHLTLRFIGDVDDVTAHEVASLLGRVRRRAPSWRRWPRPRR
jgi:RNA 2',3'-cyclic 3'-phosphodiesterase